MKLIQLATILAVTAISTSIATQAIAKESASPNSQSKVQPTQSDCSKAKLSVVNDGDNTYLKGVEGDNIPPKR